jgi:hypothetical protein
MAQEESKEVVTAFGLTAYALSICPAAARLWDCGGGHLDVD